MTETLKTRILSALYAGHRNARNPEDLALTGEVIREVEETPAIAESGLPPPPAPVVTEESPRATEPIGVPSAAEPNEKARPKGAKK